ncbi:twin-arginine translocase subunit TatC [Thiotrichales bacterium HSG1]|nr:twin-arginine translocase subunit TatC [Thiotrichales bacterium HSG1]
MPENSSPKEMPFVQHLLELRDRLLAITAVTVVILLVLMPFANDLFHLLADPLLAKMPEDTKMIAIDVASPFLTPFKLTLILSVFLAMPMILYHLWAFVAPGLYKNEKSMVLPLMVSSTTLFYLGMVFAYYLVFPLIFGFMVSMTPEGVEMTTDISRYLDFVLKLLFAFGVAFQVPIATILLVRVGIVTPESLAEKRPYIIVGAFIVGMLMTPPDMISQTLLAIPIWLLFELGLIISRAMVDKANDNEDKPNLALSKDELEQEIAKIEDKKDT